MIIGICGDAGAGKDTAGAYLVKNYEFTRIAFADKVKECAAALLGVDVDFVERHKNDKDNMVGLYRESGFNRGGWIPNHMVGPITIRHLLQRMGTEVGRNILGLDTWVKLALTGLDHNRKDIVVTDVRFQNEIDYIKAIGGKIWRVERDEVKPTDENVHVSESSANLLGIDKTILNNESLGSLYYDIDTVMTINLGRMPIGK